jgi:hypothetical protein
MGMFGLGHREDSAEEVRKYHIPDFSNWKNHDAFEKAFAQPSLKLRPDRPSGKDLRTTAGT